ncbi:MAG TPA: PD-(D/E)XK nuclease family protein [Ramlibacter sp.]|jgi:ATP-dependent helicase/nuclease subunit B|uniref:PD-(D/E)XK nuclease family protein n=1 Tax=Ramlibacter sp. TaxID=1917967 RepID=UPI002D5B7525|nr:PD-(D/E)XK nuclease family protein [Ramlibacter sp.]HZY18236.1 PD-(D/E)XK nuclease family protein [Ramlibacter sp.]
MDVIAPDHRAAQLWRELLGQVEAQLQARGAHPSRTVVLLPYAQLMPVARRAWAALHPAGFAPRFETSMNWAARLGHVVGSDDLSFDMGRDLLTARDWLERAGLGARSGLLAGRLVEAAWQAASAAAAVPPAQRAEWAAGARAAVSAGLDSPVLALEAAVARIAVEWAAASRHASDRLFDAVRALDLLVVCEGFQADPLAQALAALAGEKSAQLPLDRRSEMGQLALHEAPDPDQEAELAAACVLRQLAAGHAPVALAAVDRVLTRRVRALLGVRGVAVRDETGWKLSTTRAAAHVMGALRACAWQASSDAVLDWLKNAPAVAPGTVLALERRIRRQGLRDWADASRLGGGEGGWALLVSQADRWREALRQPRPLPQWQQALRDLLQDTGHWPLLQADDAGRQVLEVLGLSEEAQLAWSGLPQAGRRLSPSEFASWVDDSLEAGSFVPPATAEAQVVILPFNQLLARDFWALVLPGCDEVRLPLSPEPPGAWTASQRAALGLPSREMLEQERRAGWRHALQLPRVDILWRRTDETGEAVLPSPLVEALRLQQAPPTGADPREPRPLALHAVPRPDIRAPGLPVTRLSASAYEDLRRCPYRFFALRQLGLQEAAEIDVEVDKRDFGNWLHQVLRAFHEQLQAEPSADRAALLDDCAEQATAGLALAGGEFLPFAAAWPQVRDGYLAWLREHEAKGGTFSSAETEHEMPLGSVQLVGRIDRIDRLADGRRVVIDYKTEGLDATRERVRIPQEDTQLAFYAALLDDDSLCAAYVNVGERGLTRTVEHPDVADTRDALVAGILDDMRRIAEGVLLPALGEGRACEFCAARGLCRRDFWHD